MDFREGKMFLYPINKKVYSLISARDGEDKLGIFPPGESRWMSSLSLHCPQHSHTSAYTLLCTLRPKPGVDVVSRVHQRFPTAGMRSTCGALLCVFCTHSQTGLVTICKGKGSGLAHNHQLSSYRHKAKRDIKQASRHTWGLLHIHTSHSQKEMCGCLSHCSLENLIFSLFLAVESFWELEEWAEGDSKLTGSVTDLPICLRNRLVSGTSETRLGRQSACPGGQISESRREGSVVI